MVNSGLEIKKYYPRVYFIIIINISDVLFQDERNYQV